MKILGICCSPRMHGNTQLLMKEVLASAEQAATGSGLPIETEFVFASKLEIKHCSGCLNCKKFGYCTTHKDDMATLLDKMREADGILFGAPVYFWSINDLAVTVLNRTVPFSSGRKLRDKVAGAVITTGRAGETTAFDVFLRYFSIQRMINAGGVFGFGGLEKGAVAQDKRAMDESRALGRVMVRLIYRNANAQRLPELETPQPMSRRGVPMGFAPPAEN